MAEKTVRWGMIGCGDVTKKKSAPSFNKIPGSRLVAVGNRTPDKAEAFAKLHEVAAFYRDPFDVIRDPAVNVVYIATPPGSHMEYALATITAGKPVYIEKPMARTWEECKIINEAAEKKGIPVFVAYYRRSLEYFKSVKAVLDSGRLGRILQINMQQFFPGNTEDIDSQAPPWRVIPEISGGGYFHDMGCHALDILFYIFGDPLSATGLTTNVGALYEPEDSVGATLMLPDNVLVSCSWIFLTPPSNVKDVVEVIGERGRLEFSIFSFKPITLMEGENKETIATIQPEHIQMPHIQTIVSELNGIGECPSTGSTAEVTSMVMDQILGNL